MGELLCVGAALVVGGWMGVGIAKLIVGGIDLLTGGGGDLDGPGYGDGKGE